MSTTFEDIKEKAAQLSELERAELALALIESLDGPPDADVEEAWRIVDPALKTGAPVYEYEPGTWGPLEVGSRVSPAGGWQNPTVTESDGIKVDSMVRHA